MPRAWRANWREEWREEQLSELTQQIENWVDRPTLSPEENRKLYVNLTIKRSQLDGTYGNIFDPDYVAQAAEECAPRDPVKELFDEVDREAAEWERQRKAEKHRVYMEQLDRDHPGWQDEVKKNVDAEILKAARVMRDDAGLFKREYMGQWTTQPQGVYARLEGGPSHGEEIWIPEARSVLEVPINEPITIQDVAHSLVSVVAPAPLRAIYELVGRWSSTNEYIYRWRRNQR